MENYFQKTKRNMRTNLLVLLTILSPLPAMAITASGTVSDKEGPLISATVLDKSTPGKGTTTDLEGKFTLDVPDDAQIEIRYVGYVAQTLTPSENMNIILQEDSTILQEVVSIGTFTPANCNQELLTAAHATAGKTAMNTDGNGIHCVPSKCMRGYKLNTKNKQCEEIVCEGPRYVINAAQTDCEDQVGKECNSNDANAKKAKYKWEENQLKCVIQTCNKGYRPNDTGTACEVSDGPCSEEQVKAIEHATAGELKKGVCYATECEGGYEPTKDGQCTAISGNCSPMPDNAKSAHREYSTESNAEVCIIDECKDGYTISPDKLSCTENPKPRLSEEDSKAKIEELRENAQAMKDKEQSTANKLIGAAGIGATGIGAMQAASAMAEQNADEDAEQAMKAYLETFHCNYGGGINIKGGETEIELPGGNDLVSLYTEYAMLANDLKIRKEALGLKAGIESEVLIDKATSGLYDDVSLGKTGGAYASIARALMDETSADAEAWAAQKSETASKLKTGMITAGVGAAGSLIANLAVNSGDKNKNKVDQINNKYADKVKIFEEDIAKLPDKTANAKCVSGSTGTFPNCTCTQNTQIYNSNTNTCDACPGEKSVKTGTNVCDCPDGTVPTENDKCTTSPVQTKCDTTDPNIIVDEKTGECSCQNDYTIDSTGIKCECKAPKSVQDGKCVSKIELTPILGKLPDLSMPISLDMSQLNIPTLTGTQQQPIIEINLTSDNLFALGSSQLSNDAKTTITNNITQLTTQMKNDNISADDICIKITGHTDKSGGDSVNQPLSEKRAQAVKDYIVSINNSLITSTNTVVEGRGSQECTTANSRGYSKECRHVTITASNGKCSS